MEFHTPYGSAGDVATAHTLWLNTTYIWHPHWVLILDLHQYPTVDTINVLFAADCPEEGVL